MLRPEFIAFLAKLEIWRERALREIEMAPKPIEVIFVDSDEEMMDLYDIKIMDTSIDDFPTEKTDVKEIDRNDKPISGTKLNRTNKKKLRRIRRIRKKKKKLKERPKYNGNSYRNRKTLFEEYDKRIAEFKKEKSKKVDETYVFPFEENLTDKQAMRHAALNYKARVGQMLEKTLRAIRPKKRMNKSKGLSASRKKQFWKRDLLEKLTEKSFVESSLIYSGCEEPEENHHEKEKIRFEKGFHPYQFFKKEKSDLEEDPDATKMLKPRPIPPDFESLTIRHVNESSRFVFRTNWRIRLKRRFLRSRFFPKRMKLYDKMVNEWDACRKVLGVSIRDVKSFLFTNITINLTRFEPSVKYILKDINGPRLCHFLLEKYGNKNCSFHEDYRTDQKIFIVRNAKKSNQGFAVDCSKTNNPNIYFIVIDSTVVDKRPPDFISFIRPFTIALASFVWTDIVCKPPEVKKHSSRKRANAQLVVPSKKLKKYQIDEAIRELYDIWAQNL